MTDKPYLVCLCPTYFNRPAELVGNSIACFENQTYPPDRCKLILLDDTGHFAPTSGDNWTLMTDDDTADSLPNKYNRMVEMAGKCDGIVVWEDDEVYLPWHLDSIGIILKDHAWSKPSQVWTTYGTPPGQPPRREHAAGRFHASMAFSREALRMVGGWPNTKRGDFDQQLISTLRSDIGEPGDPALIYPPAYVFRWADSGAPHGQGYMKGPEDEEWYDRCRKEKARIKPGTVVKPGFDRGTQRILEQITL